MVISHISEVSETHEGPLVNYDECLREPGFRHAPMLFRIYDIIIIKYVYR